MKLDKYIFLKNEIKKKYFIGMKLRKFEYDKSKNKCFLKNFPMRMR